MTHEYGNKTHHIPETVPVSSWIWGHRLRQGQDWVEYTLEFLNVLVGYDYALGRGICGPDDATPPQPYRKYSRLGLRRFVFFDGVSGKIDERDVKATAQLKEQLQRTPLMTDKEGSTDVLASVQSLLRSYTAVEKQRSWFAKSLFPVHEHLLFWEALRKEDKTPGKGGILPLFGDPTLDADTAELDKGISLSARNFFARGGELYYLMLSAGTHSDPALAAAIGGQLQLLLRESSPAIGRLAALIDATWARQEPSAELSLARETSEEKGGHLGWLPRKDDPLFHVFAQDVAQLLRAPLGVTDALTSLAHLMAFHLTLYIYRRAHAVLAPSAPSPALLLDLLDQDGDSTLRRASSAHFREQEAVQAQAVRAFVTATVEAAWADVTPDKSFGLALREHTKRWSLGKAKVTKGSGEGPKGKKSAADHDFYLWVDRLAASSGGLNRALVAEQLADLVMPDFTKHFLGVHRKLAKSCGFVAPPQGQSARYVMGNELLKALVLALTGQERDMEYAEFLQALYDRYGLVIGLDQARLSGVFDRHGINADYYQRNQQALLDKLTSAGLAKEYSDATALVSGRLS
ncbi:hypothetical protein [Deinococcus radiotolerans]|uniref:Uncharacterized protein n=1 Tax=Deinococcus radiotolerans TaxID=1309407 RepID=A0ABQ2FRC3_9DEIO|nr:hypothetical protein [Deinococcus radiotolerans]GGL18940.1 hypothetical protein GCM10010844_42350 [Deinococcus radiotolerans]